VAALSGSDYENCVSSEESGTSMSSRYDVMVEWSPAQATLTVRLLAA